MRPELHWTEKTDDVWGYLHRPGRQTERQIGATDLVVLGRGVEEVGVGLNQRDVGVG